MLIDTVICGDVESSVKAQYAEVVTVHSTVLLRYSIVFDRGPGPSCPAIVSMPPSGDVDLSFFDDVSKCNNITGCSYFLYDTISF